VRDSIARRHLIDDKPEMGIAEDEFGQEISPPFINWDEKN